MPPTAEQHSVGYDAVAKEWHGPGVAASDLRQFLGHFLIDRLAEQPADNIVQINHDSDYHMCAGELRAKSLKVSDQLERVLHLRWGDRICVAADHQDNLTPFVIGVFLRGVVINPLHTGFSVLEFKHFIGLVQPKVIFCEPRNVQSIRQALQELQQTATLVSLAVNNDDDDVSIVHNLSDLVRGWDTEPVTKVPLTQGDAQDEVAYIACSSGTTGLPKGICITHSMGMLGFTKAWPFGREQFVLNTSALFWGTYMMGLFSLQFGCKRVFTTRQAPITIDHLLDILEQRQIVSFLTAVPVINAMLAALQAQPERRLPHLRQIQAVGCTVPPHVYRMLPVLLPAVRLNLAYGLSDVGGGVATVGVQDYTADGVELPNLPAPVPGSSGTVSPGTTFRVIDDQGERCGPGEQGELWVRRVCPLAGYLGNEAANREAITAEGFLRTGDIGRIDADSQVFIVDRRKDFFKYRGYHIAPSELEHFIEGRFQEQVDTAVVLGIEDDEVTNLPAAVIVLRKEAQLEALEICRAVEDTFSDAKRLRGGVFFVDSLPRTSSNKLRRNVVQEMVEKLYRESAAKRSEI